MALKWWQVPLGIFCNLAWSAAATYGIVEFSSIMPLIHILAWSHFVGFCCTSSVLMAVSQKRMVFLLTTYTPVVIGGGLVDLVWYCPVVMLIVKPIATMALLVSILTMRKLMNRVSDNGSRIFVTRAQKALFVGTCATAMALFTFPGNKMFEIAEFFVCMGYLGNVCYHFFSFLSKTKNTFDAHKLRNNDSLASIKINKQMDDVRKKLQLNMTLGAFVAISVMIVYYALMNPMLSRGNSGSQRGQCVLRVVDRKIAGIDLMKSVVLVVGSLVLHVSYCHTTAIFLTSKRRKKNRVTPSLSKKLFKSSSSNSRKSGSNDKNHMISEIERSSVQGD